MKIEIELRARILPDNHKCYFIFPGRGYKYFELMEAENVSFIEMPDLPIDLLGPNVTVDIGVEALIQESIARSIVIKRWINYRGELDKDTFVNENLERAKSQRRTIETYTQFARNFYFKIEKGSLFLLPSPTLSGVVLIGEFLDDPGVVNSVDVPDLPGVVIYGRRVKWLRRIEKYKLNGEILRRLASPNPVRQVDEALNKYLYDLAYGQYKYRDNYVARIDTENLIFNYTDNLVFNLFVWGIVGSFGGTGGASSSDGVSLSDIDRMHEVIEQRISINSPGSIIISAKTLIPFMVASYFALCSVAEAGEPPKDVLFTNSIQDDAVSRACSIELEDQYKREMAMMGYDDWSERCMKQRRLEGQAKMKGIAQGRRQ